MNTVDDYFVKLKPYLKSCLWGGNELETFGKKLSGKTDIGESWELSTNPNGESLIADGKYADCKLMSYIEKAWPENIKEKILHNGLFPILIKFIDSHDKLSIQVHPDNEYALKNEGQSGKNEMWYIMSAKEDAYIYLGFNKNTSREEVEEKVKKHTIEQILNKVYVKSGQTFFIPAGAVHAIGAGCLICEIQQNSDITYRLYDYNRIDATGNKREIHINQALDVLNYSKFICDNNLMTSSEKTSFGSKQVLTKCPYFSVVKYYSIDTLCLNYDNSDFISFIILDGDGEISIENFDDKKHFCKGETFLGIAKSYCFKSSEPFSILAVTL